ncbi:MAG: rhombosortase [Planctomycetota bacterium]|nr:rhombosortase [Planctomycetota bacterium]
MATAITKLVKSDSLRLSWTRIPFATVTFGFVAMVASLLTGLPELMEYNRAAITQGEMWRIVTGHFTHWNGDHFLWDFATFVGLGAMCESQNRRGMVWCVLGTIVAVSLYMLIAMPEVASYRGLSGIDTGLFTFLAVALFSDARRNGDRTLQWVILVCLAGLVIKLTYELFTGATLFVDHSEAAFVPIFEAHAIGAVVGISVAVCRITKRKCSTR